MEIRVLARYRFQSPDELAEHIQKELGSHLESKGMECKVVQLECVRDFKTWLDPCGVHPHDAFRCRDGVETAHSFTFMAFVDLSLVDRTTAQRNPSHSDIVAGHGPANRDAKDVFCIVKTYIRDTKQQQSPVLVLPVARARLVQSRAPTKIVERDLKPERLVQLRNLYDACNSARVGLHKGAVALAALIDQRHAEMEVPGPGWLAAPPQALLPVVSTANPIFPHLPEVSFALSVTFRRHF